MGQLLVSRQIRFWRTCETASSYDEGVPLFMTPGMTKERQNGDRCPSVDICDTVEISGTILGVRHVPGFRVAEVHYRHGLQLGQHTHAKGCLTYVLEGA